MFTQIVANSLIRAAELGLVAIGVTMLFSVLRFSNFAHGELVVVGAYLTFFFNVTLGLPFLVSAVLAILGAGIVAVLADRFLFRQLRRSTGLVLLIASIGLSIFLRHVVAAIWGVSALSLPESLATTHQIFGAFVTTVQLWIMGISISAMLGFHLLLTRTRLGRALRALSDNRDLAQARGIDIERTIPKLWMIVGAYAGLAGVLIAVETVLTPEMGYNLMLPVFCAVILGGIGNLYGAILGALVIAFAENVLIGIDWQPLISLFGLLNVDGQYYLPTGYKMAVSFVILALVLLFMPRGIMKGSSGD